MSATEHGRVDVRRQLLLAELQVDIADLDADGVVHRESATEYRMMIWRASTPTWGSRDVAASLRAGDTPLTSDISKAPAPAPTRTTIMP
jgi:hypothetical protein